VITGGQQPRLMLLAGAQRAPRSENFKRLVLVADLNATCRLRRHGPKAAARSWNLTGSWRDVAAAQVADAIRPGGQR
jgi:hypothetical protein